MKDLASVSVTERDEFLRLVDNVICDLDGVVWVLGRPIEGAANCLEHLRNLGKTVVFNTNNGVMAVEKLTRMLEDAGFGKNPTLINPTLVLIYYLKSINFDKSIYVIASQCNKKALREAGFKYIEDDPLTSDIELYDVKEYIKDDESVGAVFVDLDIHASLIKLQKAIVYLRRPEVLFIEGATDSHLIVGNDLTVIGPRYIQKPVENLTGRKPILVSKPSEALKNYIQKELNIEDPSRTLFVGDTIEQDMAFASLAGYKKLLTLSGNATKADIVDWKHEEQYKPDYYVENLGVLYDVLKKKSNKQST